MTHRPPLQRDRLTRLLVWLVRDHGMALALCPPNAAIIARIGLATNNQATALLAAAVENELLEIVNGHGGSGRRVRVLQAGLDLANGERSQRHDGFEAWICRATKGERIRYFSGHLAEARGVLPGDRTPALRIALSDAASASQAAEAGLVVLTSRRSEDGHDYFATRTAQAIR